MIRNEAPDYGKEYTPAEYEVTFERIGGMDEREIILPRVLRTVGYKSGIFGKWDLGSLRRYLPTSRGFDDFYGFVNTGIDYYTHQRYGAHGMYRNRQRTDEDKGTYCTYLFEREAKKLGDVRWLAQGTLYPDVIESISFKGPSATIKSHHNVGGLPKRMKLKLVEPLKYLFKDEVRLLGKALGLNDKMVWRQPFPGPGLGIRIIGDVTAEKVRILQDVDAIFIDGLKERGHYDDVWQALAVLLPIQSVGVMGDERTYENVVALRAVGSVDGMTADWSKLPYEFLSDISNKIINNVKEVNRIVYDISSKPPATIEWE